MTTSDLITAYYAAFNAGDGEAMLALLTEDVAHAPIRAKAPRPSGGPRR